MQWLVNGSCGDDAEFKHIPVAVLPPAALPPEVQVCCLQQTGPPEALIPAAFKRRQFFLAAEIEFMMAAAGIPKPARGSGEKGGVKKIDLVRLLVDHHLPGLKTDDNAQFEEICAAISRTKTKQKIMCPAEVIAAVGALDPENEQGFREIIQEAKSQQEEVKKKQLEAVMEAKYKAIYEPEIVQPAEHPAEAPAEPPEPAAAPDERPAEPAEGHVRRARAPGPRAELFRVVAPPEFVELLPRVNGLYFHWEPQHRRARVAFQRVSATGFRGFRGLGLGVKILWRPPLRGSWVPFNALH